MQGKKLQRAVVDAAGRPVLSTHPLDQYAALSSREHLLREIAIRAAGANSNRQLATCVEGAIRDAGRFTRAMRAGMHDARRQEHREMRAWASRKGRRK